jgi:TRAP-type C4-dicarboxylate transport system substrate-binding protein
MLDLNWAPVVGALIITKKAWDELSPEGQASVREAGSKAGVQLRAKARQEVDEAVEAMKKRGLTVNRPNPEQMKEWSALADGLYPRIRGKLVPAEQFDEVVGHLKTFRATRK